MQALPGPAPQGPLTLPPTQTEVLPWFALGDGGQGA